jgi:hypothetical protein
MSIQNREVIIPVSETKIVSTIISHELKNPLNAIIGFSDLIIEEDSISDIKVFAGIIKKNGAKLLDKIHSIVDVGLQFRNSEIKLGFVNLDRLFSEINFKLENEGIIIKGILCYTSNRNDHPFELLTDVDKFSKISHSLIRCLAAGNPGNKLFCRYYKLENSNGQQMFVLGISTDVPVTIDNCQQILNSKDNAEDRKKFKYQEGFGVELAICELISSQIDGRIYLGYDSNNSNIYFTIPISEMYSSDKQKFEELNLILTEEDDEKYFAICKYLKKYPFRIIRTSKQLIGKTIQLISDVKVVMTTVRERAALDQIRILKDAHKSVIFIVEKECSEDENFETSSYDNLQVVKDLIEGFEIEKVLEIYFHKRYQTKFKI